MILLLEVTEFVDPARWTWRLTDEHGALLADRRVLLDQAVVEYEGFVDPYRFVHWYADPERRQESERKLLDDVARWIGEHVWGSVGEAIVRQVRGAPVVVRVLLPEKAETLLFRPLELGVVGGRPLAAHDVSLVFELKGPVENAGKRPISERLRMLALFSQPADHGALDTRRERHDLQAMVRRIERVDDRAIELRVLQYGVTRRLLSEVLAEGEGWDVIHFSGHGLPAELVLEHADGTADVVRSGELVELLWPARERLKLAMLSACESAAATAEQTLALLGLALPGEASVDSAGADSRSLPAVAQELVRELGCAVLAMRYPVDDDFAIALARRFYEGLFHDRQPLARALQLAIHETACARSEPPPSALSVSAPALFGAAAVSLALPPPPRGAPDAFDIGAPGLAHFPGESPRFVGRAGALARASAALAPQSKRSAVLFHGIAGAGKTACALELIYRHEQGRFEAMAWYKAPNEDTDLGGALTELALALELQLPGLELAHVVNDRERLERHLPRLTSLMRSRALLLALDNVESLLRPDGTWRQQRWALLVEALVAHEGLSRVVLTSRYLPADLGDDPRVLIEPIGSLSAAESVLHARHLPNLGRLIATGGPLGPGEGRELARQALELAQGNPKLIDLADRQAADPDELRARLADAAASWAAGGSRLGTFFATGHPDRGLGAHDFMLVLEGWARAAIQRLSADELAVFSLLCLLEEDDRTDVVLEDLAAHLFRSLELPGSRPDPTGTLEGVAIQGLIDVQSIDERLLYRIHPAIERIGREAADADLQTSVDLGLANYWSVVFQEAEESEAHGRTGPLVIYAGLAAVPYLLRLEDVAGAQYMLERALSRDRSAAARAAVLPHLKRIAELAGGTPEELPVAGLMLQVGMHQHREGTLAAMRDVLERAEQAEDFGGAHAMAGRLVGALVSNGRLEEALEMTETVARHTRRAALGPWTEIADRSLRLEVLQAMGQSELVLREAELLLERMDELPASSDKLESASAWNVREELLKVARTAAKALERFDVALELSRAIRASAHERAATPLELADAAFDEYGLLLHDGRYAEVEHLLCYCREIYEAEQSHRGLACVFGALSSLEDARGHGAQAIGFARRALRLRYTLGEVDASAVAHTNLASSLSGEEEDRGGVLAHRLAAALLARRIASGSRELMSEYLASDLWRAGERAIPESLADLCDLLREREGVDLAQLLESVPASSQTPEGAFRETVAEARSAPIEAVVKVDHYLVNVAPMIDVVVAAACGEEQARADLDQLLAMMSRDEQWLPFREVLLGLLAGERDLGVLSGELDPLAGAIVREIVGKLATLPSAAADRE